MGLQVPWFGLTDSSSGSILAVKQIEFRPCRLSAKCEYYGRAKLIQHQVEGGAYEVDEVGSPFQSAPPNGQNRRDVRNTVYPNNPDDTGLDMRRCMLVGRRR